MIVKSPKASHSTRKHSKFSPSSAERWIACPGSVRLSKFAPPQKESAYAREGTEAHECLEFIVKRYGDRRGAATEAFKRWPDDMVKHALNAADLIFSSLLRPSPEADLMIENKVRLKSAKAIYGTLDYAWVDLFGTLVVIDYKYGAGVTVFTEDEEGNPNPQLMIYAAAVASLFDYEFEKVRLAIIQPRVYDDHEDPVVMTDVSIPKLKAFERLLKEVVEVAGSEDAPLSAGDHCRWCPALATCPENSKKALAQAHVAYDFEDEEEVIQGLPDTGMLDEKLLPGILDGIQKLKLWIKGVEERAHQLAEGGVKIKGYKLVAKKAQRTWSEGAEAKAAGLWQLQAYKLKKEFLSPAQLEKAIGEEAKGFVKDNTVSISSGSHLVPEGDKRAEVLSTSVFDLEDDDEWTW